MRPIPAEEFSALVGSIYDCALEPGLWPGVLTALAREMDFSNALLALQRMPDGAVLLDVSIGIAQDDLERMRTFSSDVVEQWGGVDRLMAFPLDEPQVLSWVNPQMNESRFAREWGLPLGLTDTMAIAFTRDGASLSSLGMGRHVDQGPITEAEVALARLFAPHLKRAVTISRLLEANSVERANFAAVLDGLAVAVLLVRPDLHLLHANRAGEAMIRTGDPLGLRRGRITAPSGVATALAAALAAPRDGLARRGLGVPARRADGAEMVLHVLPLDTARPLADAAAAIFVAPAAHPPPAPLAAVAALFGLTPAEVRVLELMCAGRASAEVAAALGVAEATVRTHVLRLFDKTCTHRQAELVRLVASFTLPLA